MCAARARGGDVGDRQACRIVGEDAAVRAVDRQLLRPAVEDAGHIDAVITLFEMMAERRRVGKLQPQILDTHVGEMPPFGDHRGLVGADIVEQRIAKRHRLAANRRNARRLRNHRPVRRRPVVRPDRQVGIAIERLQYLAVWPVDRKPLQLHDIADLELRDIVDRQRAGKLLARHARREHRIAHILAAVIGDRPAACRRNEDHPPGPAIFGEQIIDIMLGLDLLLLLAHQIFAQLVIVVALVDQPQRAREPQFAAARTIARAVEDNVAARDPQHFGDLRAPLRKTQYDLALHRVRRGECAQHRFRVVEPVVGDRTMGGHVDDRSHIGGDRCEAEAIACIAEIGQRVRGHRRRVGKDHGRFRRLRLNRERQRRAERQKPIRGARADYPKS